MPLPDIKEKLTTPILVLAAIGLAWLIYKAFSAVYWLIGFALLGGGTYWLIRPELLALSGREDDPQPWLVRLRQHRWQPVGVGNWTMPRSVAYLLIIFLWWFWL